jgi:ligand-binding sensor protein
MRAVCLSVPVEQGQPSKDQGGDMTKIEDLIPIEILQAVVGGFLTQWEGIFDVMPADSSLAYLFYPKHGFVPFCAKVRSTEVGEALCRKCDEDHAKQAVEEGEPIHYLCHAGMLDIAFPIIVEHEHIATVFYGQCRSWDRKWEREGKRKARETARKLGIDPEELLELRSQAREATEEEVKDTKQRLSKVATYMAAAGQEKLRLLQEKHELEQTKSETLRESTLIQSIMTAQTTIVDIDAFWPKLNSALENICKTIGADHAAMFVSEEEGGAKYALKSVTGGLNREVLEGTYSYCEVKFGQLSGEPYVTDFDPSRLGTFCHALASL